jgi:hypothetical protein
MIGVVTLTTDFGLADSYVGIMKGVILGIAPGAQIVDITHQVRPQHVQQGAYIVQSFAPYFPPGSIHIAVVDPGVGSARRAVALSTPEASFVGPDNGVFTYVWRDGLARWGVEQCVAVELTEARFWLPHVSATFHGRDVFAPVAAHLACGVPLNQFGPRIPGLAEVELDEPAAEKDGSLSGRVIHVDHFGNCIMNITREHLTGFDTETLRVEVAGQRVTGLARTFADASSGTLIALFGSDKRLELAMRNGNAAAALGVDIGERVRVMR